MLTTAWIILTYNLMIIQVREQSHASSYAFSVVYKYGTDCRASHSMKSQLVAFVFTLSTLNMSFFQLCTS